VSFGTHFRLTLRHVAQHGGVFRYWQRTQWFMPTAPTSLSDLKWFVEVPFDVFAFPGGLEVPATGLGMWAFVVGCVAMWRRRRQEFLIAVAPIAVALAASALHRYPFGHRHILFLAPALVLVATAGVAAVLERIGKTTVIGVALVAILVGLPTVAAGYRLARPHVKDEIRPLMQHVRERMRDGDLVIVSLGAKYPFRYYADRLRFVAGEYTFTDSEKGWRDYEQAAEQWRARPRVWAIFSHVNPEGTADARLRLISLDRIGVRVGEFRARNSSVYLYDLTRRPTGL
jgi:hypothetical protein